METVEPHTNWHTLYQPPTLSTISSHSSHGLWESGTASQQMWSVPLPCQRSRAAWWVPLPCRPRKISRTACYCTLHRDFSPMGWHSQSYPRNYRFYPCTLFFFFCKSLRVTPTRNLHRQSRQYWRWSIIWKKKKKKVSTFYRHILMKKLTHFADVAGFCLWIRLACLRQPFWPCQ